VEARVMIEIALAHGSLVVTAKGGAVRWDGKAIELTATLPESGESDGVEVAVVHPLSSCRHVWVPHLCPGAENVAGDFVFRAPAVLVSDDAMALALVPDLDDVAAADGWRAFLDYDHPRRRVVFGAGAYRVDGHVLFVRERVACRGQSVRLRLHVLGSDAREDLDDPYGLVARFLWDRWGRPALAASPAPPISRHMDRIVRWAFTSEGWGDTVWQPLPLAGGSAGAPVFIVDVSQHPSVPPADRRWREPRSVWNQAWFSTQRCANGLLRYARQIGSADLEARARAMTEVALAAPQTDGLFPSVFRGDDAGWKGACWTNSDRRPPSVSADACHVVDAAFTARMLLEWRDLNQDERPLAYVRRLADRLVRLQRPSGALPGWVEPDGRVASELAESSETAVSVALLFDLSAADGGAPFRAAAERGLALLEAIAADGRWEDFETYYSCAPWGAPELLGRRVARSGVYKQNTLSIFWTAEAMLAAWRATGDARALRLARRCVDELSLYQAVWDCPLLPAPTHGGFGVMNADSEWNDARQSLFAPLYFDLYRETGDAELFERGASALRASFSMLYCPENERLARAYERRFPFFGPESYGFMMENQGHGAGEPIGTFTIYTWGNGSALAAAAAVRDRFPDLFARAFPEGAP
jgi:hypothetical protein